MKLFNELTVLADKNYASFQAKLIPTLSPDSMLGVRVPLLRKFAKTLDEQTKVNFLNDLPHETYDENMLHSILLSEMNQEKECLQRIEQFLPFIDNWAVCDTLTPRILFKQKNLLKDHIENWLQSSHPYTIRLAMKLFMQVFLDEDLTEEDRDKFLVHSCKDYYVQMMQAWFYATALTKQWDRVIPVIEHHRLEDWVHQKTIQKCCDSFQLSIEQKNYLKTFRRPAQKKCKKE